MQPKRWIIFVLISVLLHLPLVVLWGRLQAPANVSEQARPLTLVWQQLDAVPDSVPEAEPRNRPAILKPNEKSAQPKHSPKAAIASESNPRARALSKAPSKATQMLLQQEHFIEQDMQEQAKFGAKIEDRLLRRSRGKAAFDPNSPLDVLPAGELDSAKNHGNGFCSAMAQMPGEDGMIGLKMWRCKPKPLFRRESVR